MDYGKRESGTCYWIQCCAGNTKMATGVNQSAYVTATTTVPPPTTTTPHNRPSILDDKNFCINLDTKTSFNNTASTAYTWTHALAVAQQLKSHEDEQGTHPKNLYLGTHLFEKVAYRNYFAPTGICLRSYQYLGCLALVFASFFVAQSLEFDVSSTVAMTVAIFNFFIKVPSIGNLYRNSNSIVYKIPRMMPEEMQKEMLQRSSLFSCGFSVNSFTFFLMTSLVAVFMVLFAIKFSLGDLSSFAVVVNIIFHMLFLFLNHMYPVTFHFIGLARGLCQMIDEFTIIAHEKKNSQRIDWRCAFENYHLLADTVEDFSKSFAIYFFVAEFFIVLAFICFAVAVVVEILRAVHGDTSVEQYLRIVSCIIMFLVLTIIIFRLFMSAASITGACQRLKIRAHRLSAMVEWEDPASLPIAHRYYEHIERGEKDVGFKSMGILISPSLAAKLAYAICSVGSAGLLYLVRVS